MPTFLRILSYGAVIVGVNLAGLLALFCYRELTYRPEPSGLSTIIMDPNVTELPRGGYRVNVFDTNAVAARFEYRLKERRDAFLTTMSFLKPGMSVDASAETIRDALAVAYDAGVIDGIRATKEMIKGE